MKKALIFLFVLVLVLGTVSPVFAAGSSASYAVTAYIGTDARYFNSDGSKAGHPGDTLHHTSRDSSNFFTYEGHRVYFFDASIYNLGSTSTSQSGASVSDAISESLVSTSWSESSDTKSNITKKSGYTISYNAYYLSAKDDTVKLSSTGKGNMSGKNSSASINLSVLSCPAVDEVVLGGEQKSGRLQTLTVTMAQNPSYPIQSHEITIPGAAVLGEEISRIGDNEFLVVTLSFVTNNEKPREYTYNVSAVDSLGRALSDAGTFAVAGDEAPSGTINMNSKFFRDANGMASVSASFDLASADDIVNLDWHVVAPDGSAILGWDPAYGNTSQSFELSLPGRYQMVVSATDVWESYAGAPLAKSAVFTKSFTVENSAPSVNIAQGAPAAPVKLGLALINYLGPTDEIIEALRNENIIAKVETGMAPARGSGEGFTLIESSKDKTSMINGRTSDLDAYAKAPFPIYDVDGNVHYTINTSTAQNKKFTVQDLDGNIISTCTLTNPMNGRKAFGLELEHGTLIIFYLGTTGTTKYPSQIFTVETVPGCSTLDNFPVPTKTAYKEGYKFGNEIILVNVAASTTAEKYEFTPSYEKCVSDVTSKVFSDDNDINLIYDFASEDFDLEDVIEICKAGQTGGSSESGGIKNSDGTYTFNFSYSDLDGDPMAKSWYEYNGKTIEVDSLSITIKPVKGQNEIKFWAQDNCGNSGYNKKSNTICVYINGGAPIIIDTPVVVNKYLLHRVY